MSYRCLACGKEIYDYSNPVETSTVKLKDSDLIANINISWVDYHDICDPCKANILRQIAEGIEYGDYEYGDRPEEVRMLQ